MDHGWLPKLDLCSLVWSVLLYAAEIQTLKAETKKISTSHLQQMPASGNAEV